VDFNEVHLMKFEKTERKLVVIDDSFPTKSAIKDVGEKGIIGADLSIFNERSYKLKGDK
jgi:hypothetical protein